MLDDIGTKSKVPPIEPTWIIETSPDNYQWGYTFALDDQPLKGDCSAAIKAIAEAVIQMAVQLTLFVTFVCLAASILSLIVITLHRAL